MPPVTHHVHSTNIQSVSHDPDTQEMSVLWKSGRTSIYDGVPNDIADQVRRSSSVTQAVREMVIPFYHHRYRA